MIIERKGNRKWGKQHLARHHFLFPIYRFIEPQMTPDQRRSKTGTRQKAGTKYLRLSALIPFQ
jgi:hypothetical protein